MSGKTTTPTEQQNPPQKTLPSHRAADNHLYCYRSTFISLADTQCTYELNQGSKAGMLMEAEVGGGNEWRSTIHTHGSS